jgi:serine/threonine protein kinase
MLDDKYRIDRLLAVGGMGAVYVGTHIKLRKRIAIKVLNPQLSSAPMIERFHREAITASQIGHEGIAQVTDIGTSSDGEPFLVMEYLEGEPLAARLRSSGPLAVEDACELGCAILSPLAAAHRAGIVHRDLKPDNVFLVRQSRGEMVKLLDFGISRTAGAESEFRLTTTGLVLGTPYYMSPEQARGDSEITPAADLYAFGVMLYEMLIGSVPIQAENYNQLMYRVMMGDYARPREHRPELPEALEAIILQAMAQKPDQRPAGAAELEEALLPYCRPAFREHASGRMSSPGLPLMTPPPSNPYGTGGGFARSNASTGGGLARSSAGTDRTMAAAASATAAPAAAAQATKHERAETPPRRSRLPWLIAGIVLVAGIAGAVAITMTGPGAPPVAVVRPTPPVPTPPPAPPAGSAANVTAPPATPGSNAPPATPGSDAPPATAPAVTVTLRFAVEPAGAAILVDGARIKGAELAVTKDDAVHTLRITAPGYVAHDETLRFDETQRLVVQLKHAARPVRPTGHRQGSNTERIDSESPY